MFSFILWVILCFPMIVGIVVPMIDPTFVSDRSSILSVLGALLLEGGPNQIVWFAAFFFFMGNIDCLVLFGHTWGSKTRGNRTTY
ncbi:hypothetical protein MMN32_02510 [Helicobacter pylori]